MNSLEIGPLEEDLDAVRHLRRDGLVLPKVSIDSFAAVRGHGIPVVAMVETARGLQECAMRSLALHQLSGKPVGCFAAR